MAVRLRLRDRAANGFDRFIRLDEKFQFHLLELTRAKGEIARLDFVAKRFADLANAERHFLARDFQHVLELREDGLRGFRPEISDVVLALHRPDVGLEHQVERTRLRSAGAVFRIESEWSFPPARCVRPSSSRVRQSALAGKIVGHFARALRRFARQDDHENGSH